MTRQLFIGVDGGATKCIVRVEDENGQVLGRVTAGPANIRLSVEQAWHTILSALTSILTPLDIVPGDKRYRWQAGMGLAGCELPDAYAAFLERPHPFDVLHLISDAHAACMGAHRGKDGAILIMGTGVVGFQVQLGKTAKVAGWGFPHDDEGGGAWLGLEAVRLTLQWLDGRLPASGIANAVFAHFDGNQDRLVTWANQANSTMFASLAPLVIQQAEAGDSAARALIQRAAQAIDSLAQALERAQTDPAIVLPCALAGSIAPFLEPFLGQVLRSRLVPCQLPPDAGAILVLREHVTRQAIPEDLHD